MPESTIERLQAALAGRYIIERQVGEGGMATVFLATDVRHERRVALKVLRPELAATMGPERFLQEVRVTANLQHPHILPLFDSGEAGGFLYYVMPFLEGESLRERMAREGELPVPEVVTILKEVVDALAAAHGLGVVHRDIKPDNVLLSGRHAIVTDFGVAKAVSEATGRQKLTTAGVALGTPSYMAPEQAAADEHVDHRTDIYAVGVLGYELLTGRPPFSGRSAQQILTAHVTEKPRRVTELRPAAPPGLDAVIMRCLEKNPADRWQSAEVLLAQLSLFATASAGLTPTQMQPTPAHPGKRVPLWVEVTLPLAVAGLALALWVGTRGRTPGVGAGTSTAAAGETRRLAVVPFTVLGGSGDTDANVWSQEAAEWIARAIDGPRPVDVVPASAVRDAIKTLGASASVADIAKRLGAQYAVAGTLARTGGQVRFEAEFLDVSTGERLRSMEPVAGSADSAEAVVARLAGKAATTAVTLFDPQAPAWTRTISTPPSLDVYRDYLAEADLFCRSRYADAIDMGKRIGDRAPDFVPVLDLMRTAYWNLGMRAQADSIHRLVLEPLRDRMTELERASQDWMQGNMYGDPALATRAAEEGFRIAPSTFWGYSAGFTALHTRRVKDAVQRFLAEDIDAPCNRDWKPWWMLLASSYHILGRYDKELEIATRGLARFPGYWGLLDHQMFAYAAQGNVHAVDSLLDFITALPPVPAHDWVLQPVGAGLELRAHGHPEAAEREYASALAGLAARGADASPYDRARALYYARRWADADTAFAGLLAKHPGNAGFKGYRGVALAALGRRAEALSFAKSLQAMVAPDQLAQGLSWQAEIAAMLGDKDEAVRLMQDAFDHGYPFGIGDHVDPAFEKMRGYAPWEALMAPR